MALSGSFTGAIRDGKYTLRVDWSATQSVANNTSTVTCKHYLIVAANYWVDFGGRDNATSIDGTSLAWSSPAVDCDGGTVYLGEVSRTVSHSADGSKSLSIAATFNIQITAGGVFWSAINASAYVALDTIPRASSISMPATVTMGRAVTLTVNRASSAFTHRLRYHFGGQQAYFAQGVGASYSWTVPKDLAYEIPNAAVGVGRVYCETYNGSTLIGTDSVGFTAAAPEDMIPSLAYTLAETGSALAGMFVQGRSRLKVQLTAVGAYGSAPRSYAIQANGATYAASSATTGALTQAGANTVTMRVTDSRGRTATRTATIDVKAYREPWIDRFTAVRCDQDGNPSDQGAAVLCTVSGGLTELPGNAGELAVYYRRSDQDEETRLPLPAPGPAFTATAQAPDIDPDHSYSFRVALRDAFTTTTRAQAVSTAAVTFDIRASGNGLAFGKVAEHEKAVEVAAGWELRMQNRVQPLTGGITATNGAEYTWKTAQWAARQMPLTVSLAPPHPQLSLAGHRVVIGEGIDRVLICGWIGLRTGDVQCSTMVSVYVHDPSDKIVMELQGSLVYTGNLSEYFNSQPSVLPTLVAVKPGYQIGLHLYEGNSSGNQHHIGANRAHLTVLVV